jgi:peroxiredoxin
MPHLNTTTAPDFTLDNAEGQPVSLADFRGLKNVVLVFTRGFV